MLILKVKEIQGINLFRITNKWQSWKYFQIVTPCFVMGGEL